MVSFPNCKINIGLNIVAQRSDGYHDIETLFYPLSLTDALEIIPVEHVQTHDEIPANGVLFTMSGAAIDGVPASNLCIKAYNLLVAENVSLPPIRMHLHKHIPIGSGLGGGSADASRVLIMIKELFELQLSETNLSNLAVRLGSDCPFFLYNRPCFATGRGEKLTPVDLDLSRYEIVLVHPNIHISTREAFSKIKSIRPLQSILEIVKMPIDSWRDILNNDFENIVFSSYPTLSKIKNSLYEAGALYASLSGSGSTVYGIFQHTPRELSLPGGCSLTTLPGKGK